MTQVLLDALRRPDFYPHPVSSIQIIETHISWVILTGPYAYKMKKPVNFGFLDFTTLEARRYFCEQELQLNQRMAPELYLAVLPVTGTEQNPVLDGVGAPIEYLVKMREFPQQQLLAQVQARGALTAAHIDALAQQISHFHNSLAPVAAEHELNRPQAIVAPMYQNFEQIRPLLQEAQDLQQLEALSQWTESSIQRLWPVLEQRCQQGMVRACHGDLHLGNAVLLDNRVVLFDCIEFNEPFRIIDIASDAAFLVMDLEDRGLTVQANRFINAWLEQTGDYAALPVLNLYKAYRALVRAKVSLFCLYQEQDEAQRLAVLNQYRAYAQLAESYSRIPYPFLAITCGISAVGKSSVALQLVEDLGAIRLRSDVERKRVFGALTAEQLYSAQTTEQTYQHLHQLATQILTAGFSVVLDATYLKLAQRQAAAEVAEGTGVPFVILDCHAPEALVAQWLAERQAQGVDPSDATLDVIKAQQANREPITAAELPYSLSIDTQHSNHFDELIVSLRRRFPGL